MSAFPMSCDAPPVNVLRCSICDGMFPAKRDDPEPICFVCEENDAVVASDHALEAQAEISERPRIARLEIVPVEYARSAVRPFGLGFGELPSSRITQALAEDERGNPPVLAAMIVGGALLTLLGLLVLAVAAIA